MDKLVWVDILMRLIPEGLTIILAGYAFSKKKFNYKLYLLSSMIHSLLTYLIRLLPINQVMHMVLSAILAVILLSVINKIVPFKAILSTLVCFILTILFEGINMAFLTFVLKIDNLEKVFKTSSPFMRNIYGLPSLLLFSLSIFIYFYITYKRVKHNATIK